METTSISEEIRELQAQLLEVRDAFAAWTELRCREKYKQRLKNLDEYECEMEDFQLPQFSIDIEGLSPSKVIKTKDKIKKIIKLIQILSFKADCPVSAIVDKI